MKTVLEFNTKYKDYLEPGYKGLEIDNEHVIEFLDEMFQKFIKIPTFKYQQIKLKFNNCCFYSNLPDKTTVDGIENYINIYLKNESNIRI